MVTIARLPLETLHDVPSRWTALVAELRAWSAASAIELRDAIVLLPFRELLPLARREFARSGGWLPRVETTETLATALGPATPIETEQISFDITTDRLAAAGLLRSLSSGPAWARRDPRGFARAAGDVMATAHALARAAAAVLPDERAAHWAGARATLSGVSGPGATERLLARVALEWASLAPAPATDRLFDCRPAAWIVVQAGGADALTTALLAHADCPGLVIDTDADPEQPFAALAHTPALALCDGFEHEAQCAAAQVIAHLRDGQQPVALIAQDRLLVRRIRALLERHKAVLHDETGWKLSTTRAAAQVASLLRCARADAGTDDLFDWLKAGNTWPGRSDAPRAIATLERHCRRHQVWRIAALGVMPIENPGAASFWAEVAPVLAGLARPRQALAVWLTTLNNALVASGHLAALRADDAGRQALTALRLDAAASSTAWQHGAAAQAMDLAEFSTWVDAVFEDATFRPPSTGAAAAQVVITPMARAMLRPFAAIVFPGADDKHLAASISPHPLLGDAEAARCGLPSAAERRQAELLAFVQTLATPRLTLLRRRLDGADPLADSALLDRLKLALVQTGRELAPWIDVRVDIERAATPVTRSAPSAPELLPQRLSASGLEAMRACPYRFFALNMLGLREADELDGEVEKRDFGNWLHEVLHRFHTDRGAPQARLAEIARLHEIARATQDEHGLADADFLPFAASFATFAPRYIAWLHERDANGALWQHGEHDLKMQPEGLGGIELHGVIDRIDTIRTPQGAALELIDYKTGSLQGLKDKVCEPLEDTQLAFYAALMQSTTDSPLRAIYLALDNTQGIEPVEHQNVAETAVQLLDGLAHDLSRLRSGSGLPALGEGSTCDYCAARGICRRDHWAAAEGAAA